MEEKRIYARHILEISRKPSTNTALLGRRVDADKNEIGFVDRFVDISGEEEVAPTGFSNDVLQARLIDGELEVLAVPSIDPSLIQIYNGDLDIGTIERDYSTSWSA